MSKVGWPDKSQNLDLKDKPLKVVAVRVYMRGWNPMIYHITCEASSKILDAIQTAIRRKDAFTGIDADNGSMFVMNGADIAMAEIIEEQNEVEYYANRR